MRVLLTGARAPATLELARLCARAGHVVHVADTHRWHICRGSRLIASAHVLPAPRDGRATYAAAVRALVARLGSDVIVPTCEEIFHLAAHRDAFGARVACEPLSVLGPLHDKWRFMSACDAAGVRRPASWLLDRTDTLRTLPHGMYILKRRYSRFATSVLAWHSDESLPVLDGVQNQAWIAQEHLIGPALCSWSVTTNGRVDAHVTYAVDTTAGPRGAAIALHSVRHAGVLHWVQQFMTHHRLTGQFAFDFIDTPSGLAAIECNPRLTSGVHCFRSAPDVVRTLLDPSAAAPGTMCEPAPHQYFRSRLAMRMYHAPVGPGAGLLDAIDDPWPQRLQCVAWAHLLASSALAGMDPRRWITRDIEWNGE